MFGYIRPTNNGLSEEELTLFRSAYCGLCHSMAMHCGGASRFAVNYDFTFMAMLLLGPEEGGEKELRCIAHPVKKRLCRVAAPSFDAAAAFSVILAYLKLRDNVLDDNAIRSLGSRLGSLFLRRSFHRASDAHSGFAVSAAEHLEALLRLEKERCASLDETADRFARILARAASGAGSDLRRRILEHLFYHVGRLIYLLDAIDDLEEDFAQGSYNPLIYRFDLDRAELSDEILSALDLTLRLSMNQIASDFQLLDETVYTGVLYNIIYFGIPSAAATVLQKRMAETSSYKTGETE